jgi:hypothetical protein
VDGFTPVFAVAEEYLESLFAVQTDMWVVWHNISRQWHFAECAFITGKFKNGEMS